MLLNSYDYKLIISDTIFPKYPDAKDSSKFPECGKTGDDTIVIDYGNRRYLPDRDVLNKNTKTIILGNKQVKYNDDIFELKNMIQILKFYFLII